jgi:hypothetical protein
MGVEYRDAGGLPVSPVAARTTVTRMASGASVELERQPSASVRVGARPQSRSSHGAARSTVQVTVAAVQR